MIPTKQSTNEVPYTGYIIRLKRLDGIANRFFCADAQDLTSLIGKATRMEESYARLALAKLLSVDYDLFQGSRVVHFSKALDPDPLKIKFHIAGGKSNDQAGKIEDTVKLILEKEFPEADILGCHWSGGERTFCHLSNVPPLKYNPIHDRVMQIIADVTKKIMEKKEVFEYT